MRTLATILAVLLLATAMAIEPSLGVPEASEDNILEIPELNSLEPIISIPEIEQIPEPILPPELNEPHIFTPVTIVAPPDVQVSYSIEDNALILDLTVTLPTPCHEVHVDVVPASCYNCYEVILTPIEPKELCTQVLVKKTLKTKIRIDPEAPIYIEVLWNSSENNKPMPIIPEPTPPEINWPHVPIPTPAPVTLPPEETNVPVHIIAPPGVVAGYEIEDNSVTLWLKVVVPTPCHKVNAEVIPLKCPNCYEVDLRLVPSSEPCIQVLAEKNVEVRVPIHYPDMPVHIEVRLVDVLPPLPEVNALEENIEPLPPRPWMPDLGEIKKIREKIRVIGGKIVDELNRGIREVNLIIRNKPLELRIENNKVVVSEGNLAVEIAAPIEVSEGGIKVGEKTINVTPDDVISKLKSAVQLVKKIVLTVENNLPVYEVEGETEGSLLFVLPVRLPVKIYVDAETGKELRVEKPWWSFLVFP